MGSTIPAFRRHTAGGSRAYPRPRGSVGPMACQCRRRRAPAQRCRSLLRRRRVAAGRSAQPLAEPPAVRRQRRAADLPEGLRTCACTRRATPLRHLRRCVLPSRCVARRCLPRRPGGLLLPAQLRHHRSVAAGRRARARCRGRLPTTAQQEVEAHDHRRVPELGWDGPDLEPRWPVAPGADRDHRSGAHRPVARAVPRRQRHACSPSVARPPRQRRGARCAHLHSCRRVAARSATRGCGGRGRSAIRS